MSSDFLSQEEVDALLRGVNGETDEPTAEEAEQGSVRSYNMATQERIVRGRMPTMELVNERFARYLRIGLFNYMHRNVEVSVEPIKVQKYAEFVRNLVVPTNLNLILAKPLRGTGLIVFNPRLVFTVIDNMFGGNGRFQTRVEGRDFTPTEQRIIQGLLNVVFTEYSRSWNPVFQIEFEFVRSEMNSQFANIATPSEIIVATSFTLEMGDIQSDMHICFPYSMLEPIRDLLYSTMQSDHLTQDRRWITMLSQELQGAPVELVCNLGSARATLRDIINMRAGDVIPLNVPDSLEAAIDGVPVLKCHSGTRNSQYAIMIEEMLGSSEPLSTHAGGQNHG
ncbi:MAG: flagellar motor switch protein FliM [Azoarcus sp.]|jgi:flagellar motor switch protein FliM|nr:flagellar motor switch protein FliM [Azoarcus sp.]